MRAISEWRSTAQFVDEERLGAVAQDRATSARVSRAAASREELQALRTHMAAFAGCARHRVLEAGWRKRRQLAPFGTRRDRLLRLSIRALQVWRVRGFPVVLRNAGRMIGRAGARRFGIPRRLVRMLGADAWERAAEDGGPPGSCQERYNRWLAQDAITERVRSLVRADVSRFTLNPKVSIVMPVYNPPERFLREAVESVRKQLYEDWELCIVDDASTRRIAAMLDGLAAHDARIRVLHCERNTGISEATNRAIAMASGDFVGLLDHDDLLAEDALYFVTKAINDDPDIDVIYTDKDHVTKDGERADPYFKPDWSPQAILGHNYVIHFLVFRRSLLGDVGLFRGEFDGAQDHDFVLRLAEKTNRIRHIPRVLYSWRRHSGSNSLNPKVAAFDAAQKAVEEALVRRGERATVHRVTRLGPFRVSYQCNGRPLVAVIISSGGDVDLLRACVTSLTKKTTYDNYEIIVATNILGHSSLQQFCEQHDLRLLEVADGFFSRMNNAAAAQANGDFLVFLNDDTEVVSPRWLEEMLSLCQRPEVGAVGPKLVYRNGGIQFTRMVLGIRRDGVPYFFDPFAAYETPVFSGFSSDVVSEVSAVSGACMMVPKAEFLHTGGFDVKDFNLSWQDPDLCLRLREKGYSLLYTPNAVLIHHGSFTKRYDPSLLGEDIVVANAFFHRYRGLLARGDPFYNPNLTDVHGLVDPPRYPAVEAIGVYDGCYDSDYWESYAYPLVEKGNFLAQRTATVQSFKPFAAQVLRATGCRKVVDVGCGPAMLLEAFRELGVDAWGIEVSREAIDRIPGAIRTNVVRADICHLGDGVLQEHRPFRVAVCMEMLEHIAADDLDRAIRNVTSLSDTVIVRTPRPNMWDRKDPTHLCVMPSGFWVDRFAHAGYVEDTKTARNVFGYGYEHDPDASMFCFVRLASR